MGLTSESLTYQWKRHTTYEVPRALGHMLALVLIGIVGIAVAIALGGNVLALVFVATALIPVPVVLRKRTKLRRAPQHLVLYRQPFYTNGWLWMTMVFAMMTVGVVGQVAVGATQAWRIALLAVPTLLGAALTAVLAYKYRGPLTLTATAVRSGSGRSVDIGTARIDFVSVEQGAPSIKLTPASGRPLVVSPVPYNVDFDSLLSTIEQLRTWNEQGRNTSPAEIEAMVSATPPDGLEVGESIALTVSVVMDHESH
ncbi:hypothetical protein ACPXCG_06070 [Gordonia sp. DT218]|uniref:hypothetical protein n=1 Tax=Gordonia sp. DT218 TaxID=3416659 RepID=UPI003CE7DD13